MKDLVETTARPPISELRRELQEAVPGCAFVDDSATLRLANTATFATTATSSLIARPVAVDQVAGLVRFASERNLTIYTASRGRNWGLGSRVPVSPATLLVDLSAMDRVLNYDLHFGTIRVEPGVTFAAAARVLAEAGGRHFIAAIGGSPEASLLGNALERGDGAGSFCERANHVCSLEVVLADGTIVDTGYGNWPGSRVADISRHRVGPGLQDLFFQSNLGIVTKMTLLLERKPEHFRNYWFRIAERRDLGSVVDEFRVLVQRRILSGPVIFWNDYKQAAAGMQYPWQLTGGQTPLGRPLLRSVSNAYCSWTGFGGVYVDQPFLAYLAELELRLALRRRLGSAVRLRSLSSRKVSSYRRLDRLSFSLLGLNAFVRQWESNPLLGGMSDQGGRALYWRKRHPAPSRPDPDADGCGVLWNAFETPLDGRLIEDVLERVEGRVLSHGFEPMTSFTIVDERRAKCFLQLVYDRAVDGEDVRAWACHFDVFAFLESEGFTHSRVDTRLMEWMRKRARSTTLRDRIARALDPASVLSPGRYEF
jgi:4-cresol dehydrogenase (hydroxylating)